MIKVDESDPIGELEPSFPYRDITIRRGVDMKEHYELQSEIGRGKFGTVFKCREKATGLMLAAKFVGIVQKQDRRNAEREVEIMSELQHPRLIQLYDAFEANNAMCFILELVEGGELFDRVIGDDFVLTEKAVTIFMRQICEGVQFIHSKNILHLDLKPENILCLTKTGNRIKIIDFGLARKFNPENKLQVLFGTPEFVAPEVVNFDAIGFGTDMWSIGVICYVLLSGLSPFMGETDVETMANVTIAQYDFDDEAFDSISNDAKDFIKKLLVKDHKSRPSATECLSHRWLQKKKPKKMVRKNSSKKLTRQTEEKTKPVAASCAIDAAQFLLPLDTTKENLIEFCSKSRSQSPVEIAAVSPSVAQMRIKKDGGKSVSGNDGELANSSTRENVEVAKNKTCDKVLSGTDSGPQQTTSRSSQTTSGPQVTVSESANRKPKVADAAPATPVEITPSQQTTTMHLTTTNITNNSYRRASDVSYMFSSFRSSTTMPSDFLGAELQGLSERLQGLQTMFDRNTVDRPTDAESLHKLLLNRQQLTAATMHADRKPKFRMSPMNRDVPFGSPPPASNLLYYMTTSSCRSAPHSKRASPEHDTATSAKEMLLKLFYRGGDQTTEPKLST